MRLNPSVADLARFGDEWAEGVKVCLVLTRHDGDLQRLARLSGANQTAVSKQPRCLIKTLQLRFVAGRACLYLRKCYLDHSITRAHDHEVTVPKAVRHVVVNGKYLLAVP